MRVIILDYDDTLFPSTHIAQHDLYHLSIHSDGFIHHREVFLELETAAISMLAKAVAVGDLVVIVTNAKLDWVRYSMKMYYHRFFEFLRQHDTPIVSAQDIFSCINPHPATWKVSCFRQLVVSLKSTGNAPSVLVSVGDGAHEAIACELAALEVGIPYRNVKLLATPSPKQMTQQLQQLTREIGDVVEHKDFKEVNVDFIATVVSSGCISFQPVVLSPQVTMEPAPLTSDFPLSLPSTAAEVA